MSLKLHRFHFVTLYLLLPCCLAFLTCVSSLFGPWQWLPQCVCVCVCVCVYEWQPYVFHDHGITLGVWSTMLLNACVTFYSAFTEHAFSYVCVCVCVCVITAGQPWTGHQWCSAAPEPAVWGTQSPSRPDSDPRHWVSLASGWTLTSSAKTHAVSVPHSANMEIRDIVFKMDRSLSHTHTPSLNA